MKTAPRPPRSSTLSLDDGDIHVCQDGPRDAPALLLIHGSAASTRCVGSAGSAADRVHRVIRIDLLGHGRSAKPAGGGYAIPEQARRVGLALDRLGVEHAVVVGHSSGGYVATALAEQRARPGDRARAHQHRTQPGRLHRPASPRHARPLLQWPPTDEQIRRFASTGFSRAGYQIPQELLDEVRGMTYHALTATMQATRDYLEQRALPDRLTALGKPLLVIFGERGPQMAIPHPPPTTAPFRARESSCCPVSATHPYSRIPPRTAALLLAFTAIHTGTGGLNDKEACHADSHLRRQHRRSGAGVLARQARLLASPSSSARRLCARPAATRSTCSGPR